LLEERLGHLDAETHGGFRHRLLVKGLLWRSRRRVFLPLLERVIDDLLDFLLAAPALSVVAGQRGDGCGAGAASGVGAAG